MTGKMITIYGVNNMGKSTHAKLLVERLRAEGYKAEYVKYPVYDIEPSGPFLNGVLRGGEQKISEEELQLWFIVNRHQFEKQVGKWLADGVIIVAEDYIGTGMAWGMAKGLDEQWLESANSKLRAEDLGILIEGERVRKSMEDGHVHEQRDDLIEKCYGKFQYLADKKGWKRVQLQPEKEQTAELVWEVVRGFLG